MNTVSYQASRTSINNNVRMISYEISTGSSKVIINGSGSTDDEAIGSIVDVFIKLGKMIGIDAEVLSYK